MSSAHPDSKAHPHQRAGTAPPPDPAVDDWVEKINEAVCEGVGWFLDAGRQLDEAKAALGHGRWQGMFDAGKIKMGLRRAKMLMRIAGHPTLSNANHLAILPPSLAALNVLAGGQAEVIEAGIQDGNIRPELTAREVRSFLRARSPRPAARPRTAKFDVAKRLQHVEDLICKELNRWPDDVVEQLADKLASLVHDIRIDLSANHRQPHHPAP